jgi:prepilin-type N-terminal cleavage/methylation domain-containing protein
MAVGTDVRSETGMTLVELLIALVVMSIGIGAIVAGFSSGIFTVVRSAKVSTAGAFADKQMEAFRGLGYGSIFTASTPMDAIYTSDSAYQPSFTLRLTGTCGGGQTYCLTTQTVSAGNGSYRIDTYVSLSCANNSDPSGSPLACGLLGSVPNRPLKRVTVVVRDGANTGRVLFRESSTFDASTG